MIRLRPSRRPLRWNLIARRAATAVILREGPRGPEVFLMERARRSTDPWSGDVSFPGGFSEPGDRSDRDTAARETLEEVGLDLSDAPVLGVLAARAIYRPDYGWGRPFAVTPVVFGWSGAAETRLNHEVADAFWVTLADLGPRLRARRWVGWIPAPAWAIDRPGREAALVWGMTRSMLIELRRRL